MRAEYKRDMNHNYLILREEEGAVDTASYQVRMLAGNVVPSILKCHLQNLDGQLLFYYDVTSRQSVSMLFEERKFKGKDLRLLLGGFVRVMEELTEYLLNPEYLVLQPEYIFLDVEAERVFFCCLPGLHREVQAQFRELVEYILPKMDHEEQDAVMLGYGIYRKALEPGFQLEAIKEAIYHSKGGAQEEESESECAAGFSDGECAGAEMVRETGQNRKETETDGREDDDWERADGKTKGREKKKEWAVGAGQSGFQKWGWLAGCCAGTLIILGILAASVLGYLPWLPAEVVMACGILALGAGVLAVWISDRRKKKQEQALILRPAENDGQKNPGSSSGNGRKRRLSERLYDEDWEILPQTANKQQGEFPEDKEADKEQDKNVAFQEPELYGETVVLCAGQNRGPASLVSREPGELATIYLEQETVVVGKLAMASDAVIPVPTVSRVHARIRRKDGEYYLADLNSRNGTAVNGRMLKGDEEYQLEDEDQVDFAQARYVFVK